MTRLTEAELKKNAESVRKRYFGSGSGKAPEGSDPGAFTYEVAFDEHGDSWLEVIIRGLSGQYTYYSYDHQAGGVLEFSTDIKMDHASFGEFSAFVYNTIDGEDSFTFLLSKDKYDKTSKFLVAIAEGSYSQGDNPPWKTEDYFLADRTHP